MTGSHEVRGSIPLGSTNNVNSLGPPSGGPKLFCAGRVENAPVSGAHVADPGLRGYYRRSGSHPH